MWVKNHLEEDEEKLRNFETNEETLANLSKEIGINYKTFWDNLTQADVNPYAVELRPDVDYYSYGKGHPVGVGFELLALAPSVNGDINIIRRKIVDLIQKGCKNFNAGLTLHRDLKLGHPLKNLFAAVIIAKKNAEDDLRLMLENSADEPTIFSVRSENIKRLHELNANNDDSV